MNETVTETAEVTEVSLDEMIKVCNCAHCRKLLVSEDTWELFKTLTPEQKAALGVSGAKKIGGIANDRPACPKCLKTVARH